MKAAMFTFLMLALPMSMFSALPPSMYKKAQTRSANVMVVRVGKVTQYRYSRNRLYVKARVKVLSVGRRTSRRIHRGSWITIRYKTVSRSPLGRFGAAATPVLKRGHVYRAYLKRNRHSRSYTPTAGARSFIKLD
jgi:hypothetical protein